MSKKTIVSIVETLLLVLMLLAMLVQCVFFISLTQNNRDGSLPSFPESEAQILVYGSLGAAESGKSTVIPYFVGARHNGGMFGSVYDDTISKDVFAQFARVLENASGGTAKKVVYQDDEKKYSYLEELYNGTSECYYIKLRDGMEFSVLSQLMSDTYTDIPENPDFVIEDMFLVGGAYNESNIIAVDKKGNVLKIYPSKNIPFNNEYFEAYNNTEKDRFEFVKIEDNIQKGRNCYFPSFSYSVNYMKVAYGSFFEAVNVDTESADIRSFVRIFDMNGDNTRFYKRASDGAVICVEGTTSFEITSDGKFTFRLGDEQDISGDSPYDDGHEYGFFEYADIARTIVSSLNEKFGGYCGVLSVKDVVYSNGECRFIYSYTVNGVPIGDDSNALELVFASNSLVSADGHLKVLTFSEEARTDMPQKTAYVIMTRGKGAISYFGPELYFGDDSIAELRWAVKYGAGDGGGQQ